MARYTITFTIITPEEEDPSIVLEAAEQAKDDLIACLDAHCINAEHLEDGTSPSVEETVES